MKKYPVIIVALIILFRIPASVYSQELNDTSLKWMIETTDGNEFVGQIVLEDSTGLILLTDDFGEINIALSLIKMKREIKASSIIEGEHWFANPHSTRYFYGPNGYGLNKGEAYYQNTWIMFNQLSYGITDFFSMGVGMMPLFLFAGSSTPVWITPKLSVPVVKDKFNIGGGVMYAHILGDGGSFGISYATFSIGNRDNNLSFGMGQSFTESGFSDRPTFMLSGMKRVGRKTYLLTENYYLSMGIDPGWSFGILSIGARSVQKRLAIDYGLIIPVGKEIEMFFAIPWLGITIPFGNIQRDN